MKKIFLLATLFSVLTSPSVSFAHPGRTDTSGCHTCKTNCPNWGLNYAEYHCHNAKPATPQPIEPIKSTYGANSTGYTKPAPEYKAPAVKKTTIVSPAVQKPTKEEKPTQIKKKSLLSRLFNL